MGSLRETLWDPIAGFGVTFSSSVPPQYDAAREAGTLHRLGPGAALSTSLAAVAFAGDGPVEEIDADGTVRMGGTR